MLFSDWRTIWETVTYTHMNSYVWGKMVIIMLSTKAKIGFYTGTEQKIAQSGYSTISVCWASWLVPGSKKDILGSVLLGRHARVVRINFSYLMGSQKILNVALIIPAFSEPWQWESWETPCSLGLWPRSGHVPSSHSVLAGSRHVAPPHVPIPPHVVRGEGDQTPAGARSLGHSVVPSWLPHPSLLLTGRNAHTCLCRQT